MKTFYPKIAATLCALAALNVSAANRTWIAAPGDALWSTAANWGGTTPVAADALFFGPSSATNLNIDIAANTSFAGITFNAGASSFNFTNNAITLGGDITDSTTNLQIINVPLALSAARNFNIASGGSLLIGGTVSGAFAITKIGTGTLTLTNNNSYSGATVVNAGTLLADFSTLATPSNIVSSASALTLSGGTFNLKGKSGAATAQTNAGTTFNGNTASALVVNQNGATSVTVLLNGLTRNSGATVDMTLPTTGAVKTTTLTTTGNNKINGNSVAYSTANGGTTWLTNSGVSPATLGAMATGSYSADTFAGSTDTDITANDSPAAFANNTVRFNTAGKTLTLNSSGVSQVTAGGILVTAGGTGSVIASAGGNAALTAGATGKEIVIHNYATLTISAPITNNLGGPSALTIGGTGTTTLSGTNTYTGGTTINNGMTKLGAPMGSAGPLGATNASLVIAQIGTLDLNGYNLVKGIVTGSGIITNSSGTTATFTAGNNNTTANLASMQVFGNVQLELNGTGWNNANGNSGLNLANTHSGGTLLSNGSAANWRFFGIGFGTGILTFNNGSYLVPSGQAASAYPLTNAVSIIGNGTVSEDTTATSTQNWSGPWTGTGTMTFLTGHATVYGLSGDLSAFQGTITVNTANAFLLTSASNPNAAQTVFNLLASGANFQYTGGANKVLLGDLNTTGNPGTATVNGMVAGTTIWQVGSKNLSSTFAGTIVDNGSALSAVTKVGTGTWTLTGANSYSGVTIVSNGVLLANGNLSGGGAITVFGSGTLGGTGTISGAVTVNSGTLAPGASTGTLAISNSLLLTAGSTVLIEVNKTAVTSDKIIGLTSVVYDGTLYATNLSGTLNNGDSFTIFSAASHAGNFAAIAGSPGSGMAWSFNPASGVLSVVANVNLNPTNLTSVVNGANLELSWPADHTGWHLQAQTNTVANGLGTNWVTIPGTDAANHFTNTVDALKGAVFYRLVYP